MERDFARYLGCGEMGPMDDPGEQDVTATVRTLYGMSYAYQAHSTDSATRTTQNHRSPPDDFAHEREDSHHRDLRSHGWLRYR
ncbi:hypothetical protein POL68_17655 [Stigmatella sp. ncwal1]|uniref:Uncharacterized protein n=1 Tax=Stigmatella ashevillensis TaxID=2995309 RepID=A0ABT5D9I0_9BACT|nr:hypothetical protein [Stigmatella ashevillena]MDC0710306.1 hypothetical protein [Stigmatella ashevillena]